MTNKGEIYRYPAYLQINFPEGLEEISFIAEINGFNYLSVKEQKDSKIKLPNQFEISSLPEDFLQKVRKEKYKETKDLREFYQFQPITYQNIEYSTSQMARQNILGALTVLNLTPTTKHYWLDNNAKSYLFGLGDFQDIIKLIATRDTKLYYIEVEIRKLIESAMSPADIESLKIQILWQEQELIYKEPKEEIIPPAPVTPTHPKRKI